MRALLLTLFGLAACSQSPSQATPSRASANTPTTTESHDEMAVDKAAAAVKTYKLAKGTKPECLSYEVDNDSHPGVTEVDVREVHNRACGGDPGIEPRLFGLFFDKTSGIAVDDTSDGSLRFLKK